MRLFSIVAFVGLVSAASISSANIAARKTCDPGEGRESASSANCITCPANTFGRGGSETCQTCPGGSSSTAGSSYCTCTAGFYKLGGVTTSGECTACAAGQYSAAGASVCTSCSPNTYSTSGSGSCITCLSGTSSPRGSSQCTPFSCPAGKYVVKKWCTDCPSGTYSAAGATSCSNCPAGTVSLPGSSACFACPAGFISHPAGIVCLQCPANTYTSGNQCVSCPGNPAGSSSCGPQPSKRAVQPVLDTCSSIPGHRRCAVLSGGGGSECINTHTTLESCGGCVGMLDEDDDSFTGKDCSMIPNVNAVKCERGQCKVMSCRNGYEPVDGGCVATSHSKAKRGVLMHARHDSF